MRIELARRHHGVHKPVRGAEVAGELAAYADELDDGLAVHSDEYVVDEDRLLAALPEGFLPVPASRVLLCVGDEDGSTGQSGLDRFLSWAKYFDAYVLTIFKPEADLEDEGGIDG